MRTSAASTRGPPHSVERILLTLDALASARDGLTLSTLARRVGAPKSSLTSLLRAMQEGGYLERVDGSRYLIGPRMYGLATRVAGNLEFATVAQPVLEELTRDTGETSLLGVPGKATATVTYVQKVESANPLRFTPPLGEPRELHATAVGKLFLAYLSRAQQDEYLKHHDMRRYTERTIASASALRAQLAQIRADGWSRTEDERVIGASAIAVPVFGSGEEPLAALVIGAPTERLRSNASRCLRCLKAAAARFASSIDGRAAAGAQSPGRRIDNARHPTARHVEPRR
jgi:DNA-binding IclR family transcriptional regulator